MSIYSWYLKRKYAPAIWGLRIRIQAETSDQRRRILTKVYYDLLTHYGSWIGISAEIANQPIFPHNMYGIFISNKAKIGRDCVIFQQVTIGSNTLEDSKHKGYPVIGNNVYIGAGAKIIGNVHIGNNCRIGANAVVVDDVPDNSVVVLERPRIIVRNSVLDNTYRLLREIVPEE